MFAIKKNVCLFLTVGKIKSNGMLKSGEYRILKYLQIFLFICKMSL